jgi:hypothetical protein
MTSDLRDCPDCEQGKHANCGGDTWDNERDCFAPCPCALWEHLPRVDLVPVDESEDG